MNNRSDQLYIYPTDTVWGIGCNIYSEEGFYDIAAIKRTDRNKPLSIMFADVNTVLSSFNLDDKMTASWLKDFFKLETTLGVPVKFSRIPLPAWVTSGSDYVSIRCLETPAIKNLYKEIQAPFFTTSLNITGEPPVTQEESARKFWKNHAPSARFIESEEHTLSGSSSTIIFISEDHAIKIVREGKNVLLVKEQLSLLF